MLRVLFRLIQLQFKTFIRQPDVVFWAIVFPLTLFFVIGLAFGSTNKELRSKIGFITDQPQQNTPLTPTAHQKDFLGKKINYQFQQYSSTKNAIQDLKKGKIELFILIQTNKTTYNFDPQNSKAQSDYLILEHILTKKASDQSNVNILKAKGVRYIDYFLPGLLAFNIMSGCLWAIGWGLVEIRMKKYLKRLTATPMSRTMFLLSHIITRIILSGFENILLIAFAYYTYGVTLSGNILAYLYLFLIGVFTFSGVAILIGSRTANPITGNGLINAIMMPMMLTSGVFFSYQNFPKILIPIIQWLPLTIFVDQMRAVFNQGATLSTVIPASLPLILLAILSFIIGIKIFKWY